MTIDIILTIEMCDIKIIITPKSIKLFSWRKVVDLDNGGNFCGVWSKVKGVWWKL